MPNSKWNPLYFKCPTVSRCTPEMYYGKIKVNNKFESSPVLLFSWIKLSMCIFILYLHTKLHLPSSYNSLLSANKSRAKNKFCVAIMSFYNPEKNTWAKITPPPNPPKKVLFHNSKLNGNGVTLILKFKLLTCWCYWFQKIMKYTGILSYGVISK